jgi:TRAP-type C4-dicarboxylate transport system substrate-binding protein
MLLLTGCGGPDRVGGDAANPRVLTMMNPIDGIEEIAAFTAEVQRRSHGSLRIRVQRSPHQERTDYEEAVIDEVRAGRADLAWTGSRAWGGSLRALHAPLLIDSYALEQRVLEDRLVQEMLDELRPDGVAGIGVLPGPLRRPVGLHGPLIAPADFDGLAIGEQQSRVAAATLRALGARPVALPVVGDATGLDGVETSMIAIEAGRYDVPGSHLTENVALWPRPLVVFANSGVYDQLSDDQRRVLREAAAAAVPPMTAANQAGEREIAANVCRREKITVDAASDAQLRSLRAAVAPVHAELRRDPATRAALDAIAALKRELAAPAATLPACERAGEAPATGTRTPLDGTWRMDTGRSVTAPEYLEENWGHWIFVFDRGHFAITQENRPACTWGYGTYTVDGDVTTWRFTDGGGDMPNEASNKPGEQFSFRLSLYRDTATLGPVKGLVSPKNFGAKPWRRLGPPTVARFSRRCPPPPEALARLG